MKSGPGKCQNQYSQMAGIQRLISDPLTLTKILITLLMQLNYVIAIKEIMPLFYTLQNCLLKKKISNKMICFYITLLIFDISKKIQK